MRPEALYLTDILGAAEAMGRFVEGVRREEFLGDELRQSAVLQKLIVIGEAGRGATGRGRAARAGEAAGLGLHQPGVEEQG